MDRSFVALFLKCLIKCMLTRHWQTVCDPAETRTLDPLIKSQLLYQLSYGVNDNSGLDFMSLSLFSHPNFDR